METLAALGGGAFVLVSLVVGLRLLLLSIRTGELPEFSVGLALLVLGGVGYPSAAVARGATGLGLIARISLEAGAMACMVLGTLGISVFNWKVFRADERWAKVLVYALCALLVASFTWQAATPGFAAAAENRGLGLHGLEVLAGGSLLWASIESIRWALMLRKRVALGLADPLVADRMKLWAFAIVAAQCLNLASIVALAFGADLATWRYGGALIAPLGLFAAASMWLAFLPPAWYRRHVAERAGAA